ncbi:MAG: hypothetical protein ACI9OJ_002888, partial [Myxococcota bacterium]
MKRNDFWDRSRLSLVATTALALLATGCSSTTDSSEPTPDTGVEQDAGGELDTGPDVPLLPLTVTVSANVTEGNAPLKVTLECNVEGDEPDNLSYAWDAGGKKSSLQTFEPTFFTSGDYNACCKSWRTGTSELVEACEVIRVTQSAALSITSPKITGAAEVRQGDCLPVSFTVTNEGGAVDTGFDIRCVLSPEDDWDVGKDSHIVLKNYPQDGIADGQSVTTTLKFEDESMCIPDDASDGQYFLLCKVDADDSVGEDITSDNAKFATTFITVDATLGALPDIEITALTTNAGQELNWGDKLGYNMSITNGGTTDSEKFFYNVYVCPEGMELSDSCEVITEAQIFTLDAGSSIPIIRSWTVPDGLADGAYCLHARADVHDTVAEVNEDNNQIGGLNCFDVKFEEIIGADLAVTGLTCTPTDAVWNGSLFVEIEITNVGNVATDTWDHEVFLGLNPAPTAATSHQLCPSNDCKANMGVGPGEVVTVQTVVEIPGDLPLTDYYCIVKIDSDDDVAELDESNNFGLFDQQVTVLSKAKTDVYVTDVTFSPVVQEAGAPFKVTYRLGNNDFSTAAGVTMCIVLSEDDKISASSAKNGSDYLIHTELLSQIKPDNKLTAEEKIEQLAGRTVKTTLPLALPHDIGTYYVGVISDCDNVLKDETSSSNDNDIADLQLTVLDPQGGCFEDDFEPNGSQEAAAELTAGNHKELGACDDEDWFKVTVPVTNTIVVSLSLQATLSLDEVPFDYDLFLYGPDNIIIDSSATTGSSDSVLAFVAPADGDYTVQVKPKKNGNEAHYSLDVQL